MKLQITVDNQHTLDVDLTNTTEMTFHVSDEAEFRERLAALVGMRAPRDPEWNSMGTTSWVDFTFPIGDGVFDFEITLFVPDDLAPSEARNILYELREEQS